MDKNIRILVGNYGSGKTELSLQMAVDSAKTQKTVLVDLDIVNPYFRSAEKREELEALGIRVLAPAFANTPLDIPALPAQITSVFYEEDASVIFDVGGDPVGATALGRYYPYFSKETSVEMLYVVNVRRPMSSAADDICRTLREIETHARLPVSALINNSNLARDTTADDLLEGQAVLEEVSRRLSLPIRYISGTQEILDALPPAFREQHAEQFYALELRMRPDWLDVLA